MRSTVVAFGAFGLALTGAFAQSTGSQERPATRVAGTVDEAAEKFLQEKKRRQSEQKDKLQAAGVNFGEVRSLIARLKPQGRDRLKGISAQRSNDLSETFLDEVALELATLGFKARDFRDQAQADALYSAASDKLILAADYSDYKLLSNAVVRAKVTGYELPPRGSAGGAVAQITVLQSYKGNIADGSAINVAMRSGQDGSGNHVKYSDEIVPAPGTEVVLVLSQVAPTLRGGSRLKVSSRPDAYTKLLEPFIVEGGQARSQSVGIGDLQLSEL